MIDATCLDADCSQLRLAITGSKLIPDRSYEFIKTDDANITMVRDGEGARILGYLAKNDGAVDFSSTRTFNRLRPTNTKAARTAGKTRWRS
jgi:hypothetical protein